MDKGHLILYGHLLKVAVGYTEVILAYFTFFMVTKIFVMHFSVIKKDIYFFFEKVENSECSALLSKNEARFRQKKKKKLLKNHQNYIF